MKIVLLDKLAAPTLLQLAQKMAGDNLVAFFSHTATDVVDLEHGHSATPSNVTLGKAGVGGYLAGGYNGSTSYTDIYSAGLANGNKLSNSGFENAGGGGDDVWANWSENKGDGTLANETSIVFFGSDACKQVAGASLDTVVFQNASVTAGKKYRIRIATRGDGTYGGRWELWDNQNTNYIVAANTPLGITAATWTYYTYVFTAPAGCSSVSIRLRCPGTQGGTCYYDEIEIKCQEGFIGDEGSVIAWAKVASAGVWTDNTLREPLELYGDGTNYVRFYKSNSSNVMMWAYDAGAVLEWVMKSDVSETGWMMLGMTWSKSNDRMRAYWQGTQEDTDKTGLGAFNTALPLDTNFTNIGCRDKQTPTYPWNGDIALALVFNTELTAANMQTLYKAGL